MINCIDCADLLYKMENLLSLEIYYLMTDYCKTNKMKKNYILTIDNQDYFFIVNTVTLEVLCWKENSPRAFYTGECVEDFLLNLKEDIF